MTLEAAGVSWRVGGALIVAGVVLATLRFPGKETK